jgi:Zn-dependent M28 family amino/carboxypeptidase
VNGDDIYNGAIDNASGVAAMLAMAHATTRLPTRPRRSVVFLATTGEEIGMLGSKYFAAHPPFPLEAITAVLNVDGPTLMLFPVIGVRAQGGQSSTLGVAAANAANRLSLEISHSTVPTISDQGPFVLRGGPALWALASLDSGQADVDGPRLNREWMSRTYHTPKDDLNRTLEFGAAVTMAQFNLLVGLQVAETDDRPQWNMGDFFGDTFGARRPR